MCHCKLCAYARFVHFLNLQLHFIFQFCFDFTVFKFVFRTEHEIKFENQKKTRWKQRSTIYAQAHRLIESHTHIMPIYSSAYILCTSRDVVNYVQRKWNTTRASKKATFATSLQEKRVTLNSWRDILEHMISISFI